MAHQGRVPLGIQLPVPAKNRGGQLHEGPGKDSLSGCPGQPFGDSPRPHVGTLAHPAYILGMKVTRTAILMASLSAFSGLTEPMIRRLMKKRAGQSGRPLTSSVAGKISADSRGNQYIQTPKGIRRYYGEKETAQEPQTSGTETGSEEVLNEGRGSQL